MPRYFLNIRNSLGYVEDEEGQDLSGPAEAYDAAVRGARSLMREELIEGKLDLRGRIEVTDESGKLSFTVPFPDTVQIERGEVPGDAGDHDRTATEAGRLLARHLSCFGTMSKSDWNAVAALRGEIRDVPRFKDILKEGERPKHVVLVLAGLIYRYNIGPEGARQIHSFYLPGEAPSLETLYIDYMDNNLGAVIDSRVALIPHEPIYRLIDERPEVRKLLWRQTLVQGAIFRQWLVRNSNLPAHAALAHFFCEMFSRAQAAGLVESDEMSLPLTQELVSEALGLTSVHTNRTIQVLRSTGAVEWRSGKLKVRDWDRLQEMADFSPRYLHLHGRQPNQDSAPDQGEYRISEAG